MSNPNPPAPYLVMLRGAQPFRFFPLNKTVITLGRAPTNDIVIMDRSVSRYHARLLYQNGQWVIEDLGSDNGVWINGVRIAAPTILLDDIIFGLGPSVRFEMELWPDPPQNVRKRRLFPKWLAPAGLLGLGVGGLIIAGLVLLAILGVLAYFAFGWGGGEPWIQIEYAQAPESAPLEDLGAAELAAEEYRLTAPEVVIIDLDPALYVPLGGSFLLQASAYDEDGIARMDLWVDDQLALSQSNPDPQSQAPFTLQQDMLGTSEGTFGIVVKAFDSQGNMGESMAYYVTVSESIEPDLPAPVVYNVEESDTLESIAAMTGVSVPEIQDANLGLDNLDEPGSVIALPNLPPPADTKPQLPPPDQIPLVGLNPVVPWDLNQVGPDAQPPDLPGQVLPAYFPDPASLPNLAQITKPVWNKAQVSDCKVTLSWKFSSPEAESMVIYRRSQPQEPGDGIITTIPATTTSYVDTAAPGYYMYTLEAVGKLVNNTRERVSSSPQMVIVKNTPNCVTHPQQAKILFFQPVSFHPHQSGIVRANIRYGIYRSTSRRLPIKQGETYALYDWKNRPVEVMQYSSALLLNPDQPLIFSVDARGLTLQDFIDQETAAVLGSGFTTITQSDLNNKGKKEWFLQGSQFAFYFKLWSEQMQWTGKGWGAPGSRGAIPAPTGLTMQDSEDGRRKLKWNWSGDKNTIDGFIVYRSYNCPGKGTVTRAPMYQSVSKSYSISFRRRNEPAGCAYKYQVSAYGRPGESALSNALQGNTQITFQAARVTFEKLEVYGMPGSGRRGNIELRVRGDFRLGGAWLRERTYPLNDLAFNGMIPNNRFGLLLNEKDKAHVGFSIYWYDSAKQGNSFHCSGSQLVTEDDLQNLQGKKTYRITSPNSKCVATFSIEPLPDYTFQAGSRPPVQADLTTIYVSRVGYQVFSWVWRLGSDPLEGAKFLLQYKWGQSCPGKPDHIYGSSERWVWGSADAPPGWYYLDPQLDKFYEDTMRKQDTPANCTRNVWINVSPGKPEDNAGWTEGDYSNNQVKFDLQEITKMKSDH